jgi:hypothetical protein
MRRLLAVWSALQIGAGASFVSAETLTTTADPTIGTEMTTTTQTTESTDVSVTTSNDDELIEADASTSDDLVGMVQSVDRRNRSLVIQDGDGNNHFVSLQDDLRLYRRGEEVSYRDVEPNDVIRLDYESES